MNVYFISEQNFSKFLSRMIESEHVVGPTAKQNKFVFKKLETVDDLRLDYDVTLLPPKKEIFPVKQALVRFDGNKYEGCVNPQKKILFGVHFYDAKAIDQLDTVFAHRNKDINYLANRNAITLVISNIQNVAPRAAWGTVGKEVQPKGHDAWITKLANGYVFEIFTDKGDALMKFGSFESASEIQVAEARTLNEKIKEQCPERLEHSSEKIAEKVRKYFNKYEFWEAQASKCFSCGTCNIVCPTCYCFDVQDKWNLDQKSGVRFRVWDACLTEDFSKISLGGGAEKNFRATRGERFRHRIMRKTSYLNSILGGPACVGCGRCSTQCTADIADPVRIVNKIMED